MTNENTSKNVPDVSKPLGSNVAGKVEKSEIGRLIQLLIDGTGVFLTILGGIFGGIFGAAIVAAAYIGLRIGTGFRIIPKQQFLVIERLGKFHCIAHDGPQLFLFLGLIDKIKLRETLVYQSYPVYRGDKEAEIDFTDASAPVSANVWYAIADPDDKENNEWDKVNEDIFKYTYAYGHPHQRLKEVVDGFVRPLLQDMSLDEAQKEKTSAGRRAGENAKQSIAAKLLLDEHVGQAMQTLGAYFDRSKPFVLSDIDIPAELQKARSERLIATVRAFADSEAGRGIREAIDNIKKNPVRGQKNMSEEMAIEIFLNRTGLKTIEQLEGANFQLIGSDVGGVIRTLGIGPKKGGNE